MTAYDNAVANQTAVLTIDMGLLGICQEPFPKAAHAAAAVLTALIRWQEYCTGHELNYFDGRYWVFMRDTDWEDSCGVSRGQASRILGKFEDLGWVESMQMARPAARSKRLVTWYRVVPDALPDPQKSRAVPRATSASSARHRAEVARGGARDTGVAPYIGRSTTEEVTTSPRKRAVSAAELQAWQPSQELWDWSLEQNPNLTAADVANFKDHHVSAGTRVLDVPARWRTWVRNSSRFGTVRSASRTTPARRDQGGFDAAAAAFLRSGAQTPARRSGQLALEPGL